MDTFLTILYVMAEDFCKIFLPPEPHPGPSAALSRSEVVTLALCGQWQDCGSERGLYRYAQHHLRAALPSLPARAQYNRQVRRQHAALVAFFLSLVHLLAAQCCAYDALDSAGGQGGCQGSPTLAGVTGWAGMQESTSCWPSTRLG